MKNTILRLFRLSALAISVSLTTAGCGGGGSAVPAPVNGGTRAVLCTDAPTSPNYSADLKRLLRWTDQNLPVRVRITTSTLQGNQVLEDRVRVGIQQWVQRSGGGIAWAEVPSGQNGQVNIRIEMLPSPATQYLGITDVSYSTTNNQLRRADTVIYVWPNMSDYEISRLAETGAHEFGHALGILGHSASPNDLMYTAGNSGRGLTEADMNTVRVAYCGERLAQQTDDTIPSDRAETKEERTITIRCDHP